MSTPYIGFTNDTLKDLQSVNAGQEIKCDKCGNKHILEAADDGSELILFYECGSDSYIGAIDGKLIVGQKSDVSGEL